MRRALVLWSILWDDRPAKRTATKQIQVRLQGEQCPLRTCTAPQGFLASISAFSPVCTLTVSQPSPTRQCVQPCAPLAARLAEAPIPSSDSSHILARGLELLGLLCRRHEPAGVRELSRECNWSRSSVQRLLTGLVAAGFVRQDENGQYVITPRVVSLARHVLDGIRMNEVAAEILGDLEKQSGETAALFVLEGFERVCIATVESKLHPRDVVAVGARRPAHLGASGKTLLAFQGEKIQPPAQPPPASRTKVARWRSELKRVRTAGYAESHGERVPGLSSVAAPVFDGTGTVVAALTLSGPTVRFGKERVKRHVALVKAGARRLSDQLKDGRVREGRIGL
jgi:IclR family transcriptional regulator, KDG regulon repressor